jgi:hypothetical protein
MYIDMQEQINLVSPEAIPALYQYQDGIKVLNTSTQLVCEKGHVPVQQHWYLLDLRSLKLCMGGVSVVLKSITIINNKPGVSNVIPQEQRKKTNKK